MAIPSKIPPSNSPFVDPSSGYLTRPANNFLQSLVSNTNAAAAGSVTTAVGSGLSGGGAVADGISIGIAINGVTNAMIRESAGYSVIGRFAGTAGNVADITATANNRALARQGGVLAFFNYLDGMSIGPNTAAPLVRCVDFRIDQAPTAETVVCTHTITISVNGTDWKIPIVAA